MNLLLIFCSLLGGFSGCGGAEKEGAEETPELVSQFEIAPVLELCESRTVTVTGRGMRDEDELAFRSAENDFRIVLHDVTPTRATFTLPAEIVSGTYEVSIRRDSRTQRLGSTTVRAGAPFEVPERAGMTLRGVVWCGGEPLANVLVSDGVATAVTDTRGRYYLPSEKEHGYVFVTLPSGYEPAGGSRVVPGFWTSLTREPGVPERHDFELRKVDNDRHLVIAAADFHLGGRGATDDVKQFRAGFLADVRALVAADPSLRVYTLVLGDFTWDRFWYSHGYDIPRYIADITAEDYPTLLFHVMGNHDNDGCLPGDFGGESTYKKLLGPTFYSANLGRVHYVFLDDIIYQNKGASDGVLGDRRYRAGVTDRQLEWLRTDLEAVGDKDTPIVVVTHAHTHTDFNEAFVPTPAFSRENPSSRLMECFEGFRNVHILSGHTHYNTTMTLAPNLTEHNTASVCGTFWWPGKLSGVGLCADGTPTGYGVYRFEGRSLRWHFKPIGKPHTKQFRVYDMNVVRRFFARPEVMVKVARYAGRGDGNDYAAYGENELLVNVWNYDGKWTVSAEEEGQALFVERVFERDPLHTLVFDIPRVDAGEAIGGWMTVLNPHMFRIRARTATAPVVVTVRDRFGNVYTETVERPKAFSTEME